MAKKLTIKGIATLAEVSAGTVDRVIHNRGYVSEQARAKVEKVLADIDYRYNIHTSAIALKKSFKIVISIPEIKVGEYWGLIRNGIETALFEYSDVNITCKYFLYDQFDINSCREAFHKVVAEDTDIVIFAPAFMDDSYNLCRELDSKKIPYIFIDSTLEGANPLATICSDQKACGKLAARILESKMGIINTLAILSPQRTGEIKAQNSLERKSGFIEYFHKRNRLKKIKESTFSVTDPKTGEKQILKFIKNNKNVKGIAVLNSRGYLVAETLKKENISNISVISFDLTEKNQTLLEDGHISALICQRPQHQGFQAVKTAISHLLYRNITPGTQHIMPIDVIYKENLPFYSEITPPWRYFRHNELGITPGLSRPHGIPPSSDPARCLTGSHRYGPCEEGTYTVETDRYRRL